MKPLIVLLITGTLAAATVTAQVPADSAKVYFRLGHRQYDPAFRNNSAGITPFVKEVKRHNAASNIERITVRSYTSPDGSNAANERLSRNRCSSISELILNETGIDPSLMHTEAEGIAWDELLRMVEADPHVPYRDEVTELLRNTPLWVFDENNRVVGGRKKSLMELREGVPYRWLYTNIFPALRNAVAVVLQNNVLFSGTIYDNLRWGDENATDEQCREACRLACADEFIERFPQGYNTYIERGGTNVSGGQKQRLCIARALLKKPKVLILDDSTSAVDTATDARIRAAMRTHIPGTTKIIIAQRISSVEDADRVLVLDNGRISAFDTPARLLETNPIYQEVYNSQTGSGSGDFDHAVMKGGDRA